LVISNLVMPDFGPSKTMHIHTIGDGNLPGEGGDMVLVMLNNIGTVLAGVVALDKACDYC
jgi:hypothetical protein